MRLRLLAMIIPVSVSLDIYDNTTFGITRSNMCLVKFVWPIHNQTFHMHQRRFNVSNIILEAMSMYADHIRNELHFGYVVSISLIVAIII